MEGKPNGSMKNRPMGVISPKWRGGTENNGGACRLPRLQWWRGPFSDFRVDSKGLQCQVRSWCASYGCEVRCWFPTACASFRRLRWAGLVLLNVVPVSSFSRLGTEFYLLSTSWFAQFKAERHIVYSGSAHGAIMAWKINSSKGEEFIIFFTFLFVLKNCILCNVTWISSAHCTMY
jgi:hypothetical protein